MSRSILRVFSVVAATGLLLVAPVRAQNRLAQIKGPIFDTDLVTLSGNVHPLAVAANDKGRVSDGMPMSDLWLLLKRAPEVEKAWLQLLDDQQNPKSPSFHKWLTTQEIGDRFGPAPEDINRVSQWLESHGFTVGRVATHGLTIVFSGTAGQVREAFHTEIHYFDADGGRHFANASDPQVPAALAPAVVGPVSLNNFMPHPLLSKQTARVKSGYTTGSPSVPYTIVPGDMNTIYNFNPVFNAGVTGAGVTVVALGVTDLYSPGDFGIFRKEFGLARPYPLASLSLIHPPVGNGGTCTDPGYSSADAPESVLDIEWSSAAAPNATIVLASCANTSNFGGFIALDNLLTFGPIPQIVSISYGIGEDQRPTSFNQYVNSLYQVAAADGVSIFVAAGDYGAATDDGVLGNRYAVNGVKVNGFASTPYDVAVGGTDFGDVANNIPPSTYWNSTNGTYFDSALSYVPEIPWNNSCGSLLLAQFNSYTQTYGSSGFCNSGSFLHLTGGGGGPSAIYTKPGFQIAVFGNPNDGWRDLPDISLFAGSGVWGHNYEVCYADTANGGHLCTAPPNTWYGVGGTSVGTPIMAGIMALVDEKYGLMTGQSYQGNPLSRMYAMAGLTWGGTSLAQCSSSNGASIGPNCIYYDITQGDTDVPCAGSIQCYLPSGTYGVLSTSTTSYQPAYGTTPGWDFATGLGTVNVFNFVSNY